MKKPHLEVAGKDGNGPLSGRCSSCRNVWFFPGPDPVKEGNKITQEAQMQILFQRHFIKVHENGWGHLR